MSKTNKEGKGVIIQPVAKKVKTNFTKNVKDKPKDVITKTVPVEDIKKYTREVNEKKSIGDRVKKIKKPELNEK